jgi:hypothetical protein
MNIYTNNTLINRIELIVLNDGFEKNFKWHYLFILHHLRIFPFIDRTYTKDNFIPVNMDILKSLVSYNYARVFLKNLVDYGVIECDNIYFKNAKSTGYKLKDEFYKEKFKFIKVEDKRLNNKLDMNVYKDKDILLKGSDGYKYVTMWMEQLSINKELSYEYIEKNITDENKLYTSIMVTDIFEQKFAKKDTTGNRLHNNLTNLPTPLRAFTTINNQQLCQVDIKNSQPLFLYIALRNYNINKTELDKYKTVVCETGFYEFFAERLNFELTENNRTAFKKKIFGGVLFDKNRSYLSKYETAFKTEFPEIFNVIRSIKSKKYEEVAIMLQKTESKFIFSCIEELMFLTKNEIELLTIHDSICTVVGKEQTVKKVMEEQFEKTYSIKVQLKVEKFAQ